jgi:hypothetical protein
MLLFYAAERIWKLHQIKKGGLYVSKPGRKSSYTNQRQHAARYITYEAADANRCKGNEHVSEEEK